MNLLEQVYGERRASFSFPKIWSLYLSTSGQAIPSAFGLYALAQTIILTETGYWRDPLC